MVAITEIATAMALRIVRIETAIAMAFQIARDRRPDDPRRY
jgi:hypothetical protein